MREKAETKKVTVRFPTRLRAEMQHAIIQSGYGLHGKSRWAQEALTTFLQLPHFIDLVDHGVDINQAELLHVEAFYFGKNTLQQVKSALVVVRGKYPLLEGVQSALIRAAVVYKLMLGK